MKDKKINSDNIALGLLFFILLLVATWQSCKAQGVLDGHRLYKAVEVTGQIHVQGNTGSLIALLSQFGAETQGGTDIVYVLDLNYDGIINNGDLTALLGQWTNVVWQPPSDCEDLYICFLLDFPLQIAGTNHYPGQPFKMVQTTTNLEKYWFITD